eukprot:RCo029498
MQSSQDIWLPLFLLYIFVWSFVYAEALLYIGVSKRQREQRLPVLGLRMDCVRLCGGCTCAAPVQLRLLLLASCLMLCFRAHPLLGSSPPCGCVGSCFLRLAVALCVLPLFLFVLLCAALGGMPDIRFYVCLFR